VQFTMQRAGADSDESGSGHDQSAGRSAASRS
jgi:hypothetical protein